MIKEWNGLKFSLPRQNDAFTFKEVLGEFNQYCFDEWLHLIKADDIVIDLGAHIGLFSLAVCRKVAQVFALEPDEENFHYLVDNIQQNNITNITPIKKAIAMETGKEMCISDLFQEYKIDFCKLIKADIAGLEYEIFLNCPQKIIHKVGIFLIEYHKEVSATGKKILWELFSDYGYQIHFGEISNYGGTNGGSLRAYNKALFK